MVSVRFPRFWIFNYWGPLLKIFNSSFHTKGNKRNERREKAREDKEKKRKVCSDKKALYQDICCCFTDLSCYWLSHTNKLCISQEGWKGYFVVATNISAVHCVLQRQPTSPCLLRSLDYLSMSWNFRNRIVFFVMDRNCRLHNHISASKALID